MDKYILVDAEYTGALYAGCTSHAFDDWESAFDAMQAALNDVQLTHNGEAVVKCSEGLAEISFDGKRFIWVIERVTIEDAPKEEFLGLVISADDFSLMGYEVDNLSEESIDGLLREVDDIINNNDEIMESYWNAIHATAAIHHLNKKPDNE